MKRSVWVLLGLASLLVQRAAWASDQISDPMIATLVFMGVVLFLTIYFTPTIVGFIRKKSNKMAILVLNFFLGWTLVGWVVALVWAVTKEEKKS